MALETLNLFRWGALTLPTGGLYRGRARWGGTMANAPKKQEIDHLFSAAYDELRRLAATIKGRNDRVTLDPTGLVNEAWIRLSKSDKVAAQSLPQFKRPRRARSTRPHRPGARAARANAAGRARSS